eukprot:TRINITY_DN12586_c3_g1_i1.p1 TRINITY_DN12586_c3_g1~~TRINITY_DN12586_c3_g1_i1.p1  ORF type:complete len:711 (-),score=125.78 TRINITY_DN12586_c3_g1_i1:121-2253(-)
MGQTAGKTQLDETYFVQKVKLGQGTFGTVWRAKHRQQGHTVAMKQLDKASLPRRGVTRTDIEREASMMKACNHVNITQLYDTFEDDTSIYLALEYCDGGDFGDKVKEIGNNMSEMVVAEYMRQICAGINHLHVKNICHRDIKPDNFMVSGDNVLKITDFGLAVYVPAGSVLTDKCGTPAFMAPEQHQMPRNSRGYGFPIDVWAAGVTMYMVMFGGKHPFLNRHGGLDDNLLLNGTLDFRDTTNVAAKGLDFFGLGAVTPLRFSDHARGFCQRMVTPHPGNRASIKACVESPWLIAAAQQRSARNPSPAGSPAAARPTGSPIAGQGYPQQVGTPQQQVAGVPPPMPGVRPQGGAAAAVANQRARFQGGGGTPGGAAGSPAGGGYGAPNIVVNPAPAEQSPFAEGEMPVRRRSRDYQTGFMNQERRISVNSNGGGAAAPTLPSGVRCRYEPTSTAEHGLLSAVVEGFNDSDCTYNLDVRQHAGIDRIAPERNVSPDQAWPPGILVSYYSNSVKKWLPAVVKSFNPSDQTYNLDLREHADCDFIRLRADRQQRGNGGGDAGADPSHTVAVGRGMDRAMTRKLRDPSATEAVAPHGSPRPDDEGGSGPGMHVGPGNWCSHPEHGFAVVCTWRDNDGFVELEIGGSGGPKMHDRLEVLRAPNDPRCAWPPGTLVGYHSASAGGWIDAKVVSFNSHNNTYNLDVRQEADADKVRPR